MRKLNFAVLPSPIHSVIRHPSGDRNSFLRFCKLCYLLKQCTTSRNSFSGRLSSRSESHNSTKGTARNLRDIIQERNKMARLKKSNVGASASNHPITRSHTVSRATNVAAKASVQPAPKSACFRDSSGKKRYRPGSKALREIRHYQRGTGLLIPRSPFTRVIKQISQELTGNSAFRFTSEALECLQVASEAMMIQLFEDSVWTMVNAKRQTLMVRDIELVRRIRGTF